MKNELLPETHCYLYLSYETFRTFGDEESELFIIPMLDWTVYIRCIPRMSPSLTSQSAYITVCISQYRLRDTVCICIYCKYCILCLKVAAKSQFEFRLYFFFTVSLWVWHCLVILFLIQRATTVGLQFHTLPFVWASRQTEKCTHCMCKYEIYAFTARHVCLFCVWAVTFQKYKNNSTVLYSNIGVRAHWCSNITHTVLLQ